MKKKILYLIPHLQNQGPVAQFYSLVCNLDREQFEPVILTFFPERDNSMLPQFKNLGIKVIQANTKKWQIIKQQTALKKAIQDEKPDILHSNSAITDGICSGVKISVPFVITIHNNMYEDIIVQYGKFVGGVLCKREERAIQKADCVITCSNMLKKAYEKMLPREYVAIPNGIEASKWDNSSGESQEELRIRLGLSQDKLIFISTGALIERKDPLLLLRAFDEARIPNAVLLMLGNGVLEEKCKQTAGENVIFIGRVSNVKDYLYAADVLVSASKSEGLPYAILEAECTGIRMILSDIPQHREAVGENAEKVEFFECGDKERLKVELYIEKKNNHRRMDYEVSVFSAQTMTNDYMKLYNQIIRGEM